MLRSLLITLTLLSLACDDPPVGPGAPPREPRLATSSEDERRPPHHTFGEDTYRTGAFTGQGITRPGLSCGGSSAEARVCSGFLPSAVDGALLDVTLAIPHGGGPHPLVVLLHGWAGSKSSSDDIAQRLLGAGYAVLRYSARGFGDSWGQVNLADVHVELRDLRSIVGHVVDHPGFRLDAGAVAVTGASYGGGQSWLAAMQPKFASPAGDTVRIRTIVPIVPWSDLLYSLVPNGRPRASVDRPGGFKLSYVNALYASGLREDDPERPYPNYPDYLVAWHGWMNAMEPGEMDPVFRQIEDGLAGYRSIWWQEEQFWDSVASRRLPVFQVQGFTDDLFPLPEAKRMLLAIRSLDPAYPIASYFGDLGHPRASNKEGELDYVLDLLQQWLDYYLKGVGTEPQHVIRAAITRPREQPFDVSDVRTVATWGQLADDTLSHTFADPDTLLNPLSDPMAGFFWDPLIMEGARELEPLPEPPASPVDVNSLAEYEVSLETLSGGSAILIAGQPCVSFHASTLSYRVQLNVRLFDVAPDGTRRLITRGTYTLDSGALGVPIGEVPVTIPTYGNLYEVPAGHTLRLEITNLDSPYITPSRVPSATEISEVRLDVPVRTAGAGG